MSLLTAGSLSAHQEQFHKKDYNKKKKGKKGGQVDGGDFAELFPDDGADGDNSDAGSDGGVSTATSTRTNTTRRSSRSGKSETAKRLVVSFNCPPSSVAAIHLLGCHVFQNLWSNTNGFPA